MSLKYLNPWISLRNWFRKSPTELSTVTVICVKILIAPVSKFLPKYDVWKSSGKLITWYYLLFITVLLKEDEQTSGQKKIRSNGFWLCLSSVFPTRCLLTDADEWPTKVFHGTVVPEWFSTTFQTLWLIPFLLRVSRPNKTIVKNRHFSLILLHVYTANPSVQSDLWTIVKRKDQWVTNTTKLIIKSITFAKTYQS